ncbi:MAG TPA: ATP-binding protein [Thermoanaerobaculia bacterium]|nr:ATP-binding protein [Thermoanaerobaculia bacterium]
MVWHSYHRLLTPPSGSFFLFGIRGVGKSTWARSFFPKARHFDLLDESLYHELLTDPSLFAAQLAGVRPGSWVIVDEVQRIPSLLNEVHRLIETRRLRFALLGSSARKLKSAGTNLLAGRALRKQMFPLTPAELGKDFMLEEVLSLGSIPIVWVADDRLATLEAYVQTYLREEIRAEALVRNLPGFLRFLPVAALFHGQLINVSGIARDAGTARTTVEGYLEILEDTLLAFRLPGYEAKLRVRERKHPKLYWVDPGLVRAVKKQLGPLHAEERGPLVEGWILTLLRTYHEKARLFDEIFYWSPLDANVEVDFLLRRGRNLLAIEVKSPRRFVPQMLSGLRAISELPGVRRRILVYGGTRPMISPDGIEIVPIHRFLAMLEEQQLWP